MMWTMSSLDLPIPLPADAVCRGCGYRLRGLPTERCPECGNPFDSTDPVSYCRSERSRFWGRLWRRVRAIMLWSARLGCCAGISWLLYEWEEGALSFLFWTPIVYLAARRKWATCLVFLSLTPYSVLLVERCRDYTAGSSLYVRHRGNLIQTPQGSADPRTRMRGFDPGCGTRSSNWWLRHAAERHAVPIMHFLTGPPPGAYRGPYPTQEEAANALRASGQVQPQSIFDDGRIRIAGQQFTVDTDQLTWWGYVVSTPDKSPPTAALFKSRCLIVRVPKELSPKFSVMYVFDTTTGQAFAVYWEADADGS